MDLQVAPFEPEPFQYDPLPTPSSIRLLTLFNLEGKHDRVRKTIPVEGILRTVDLADEPVYKALSYTWGNPFGKPAAPARDLYDTQWPLVINGRLLFVGRSLSKALRALLALPKEARGIDKRLLPFGRTELIRSSEMGYIKRVSYCLQRRANVNAKDQYEMTALHYAAGRGYTDIVKLLLSHGADPDLLDDMGRTPLAWAISHQETARLLREAPHGSAVPNTQPDGEDMDSGVFDFDLWIDGICIDQSNLPERNAQVAMMDRIYSASTSTVVWLGYASKKTLETLSIVAKTDEPWVTPTAPDTQAVIAQKRKAMDVLANRSWFKRRWIIQEYCLAQNVEVFCGQMEIDTKRLPTFGPVQVNFLLSLRHWYLSHAPVTMYLNFPEKAPLPGLVALIVTTWGYESGDPRDGIFSLIGLAKRSDAFRNDEIVADYAKPASKVFVETGRLLMEAEVEIHETYWKGGILKPLEGLSLTQNQPANAGRIDGVPSWVPNFHLGTQTKRISSPHFHASGKDTQAKIWPSEMEVLKVDACFLDTIARVDKIYVPGGGFTPNLAVWFEIARSGSDGVQMESLWRTLMAGDDNFLQYGGDAAEPVPRQSFKNYLCKHLQKMKSEDEENYKSILRQLDRWHTAETAGLIPTREDIEDFDDDKQLESTPVSQGQTQPDKPRFEACLAVYSRRRVLFRTKQGYVGLGFDTTQPGDQVWILAGVCTPYILTPVSDVQGEKEFRFVGECYVHGVMHGEAVGDKTKFEPIGIT